MSDLRRYGAAELSTLRKLRSLPVPLSYAAIAERLGRTRLSLINAMRNPPKTTEDDRQQRREALVSEFEETKSVCAMARRHGITHVSIINMLDRAGLDSEMRALIRAEPAGIGRAG